MKRKAKRKVKLSAAAVISRARREARAREAQRLKTALRRDQFAAAAYTAFLMLPCESQMTPEQSFRCCAQLAIRAANLLLQELELHEPQ